MYKCPKCGQDSISALGQFTLSRTTTCKECGAVVKVKRKFTNYLVLLYLLTAVLFDRVFAAPGAAFNYWWFLGLIVVAAVQVQSAEYIESK
jgi:hypothetical protein